MTDQEFGKKAMMAAVAMLGPEAPKSALISAAILGLISAGFTPADALNAVCGEGVYDRLVSDLYDALRAKAA